MTLVDNPILYITVTILLVVMFVWGGIEMTEPPKRKAKNLKSHQS